MELNKVHSDERRDIHVITNLLDDGKEFSIITLNPRKAIGACSHTNEEDFFILKGEIILFIGDERNVVREGYHGKFSVGEVHGFYSEKGATIVEYGITEKEKLESIKDEKMLKELSEINGKN